MLILRVPIYIFDILYLVCKTEKGLKASVGAGNKNITPFPHDELASARFSGKTDSSGDLSAEGRMW